MQEATVDRLSKIIAPRPDDSSNKNNRFHTPRPQIRLHLGLAEGWFSLFLLALVVYSTIWSVQSAGWVDNLSVLSLTTALGLLCGLAASKQRRVPRLLVHLGAVALALLLAFWQTAGADYAGNTGALLRSMHAWLLLVFSGGTSSDDTIFLFLITTLGFLLAYTSAWLVYRTRSPWLMILANAVILLINLSYIDAGFIVFLVVFLVAALLLLLRFNLYESSVRWRRLGLRCSDDLGWEFMQAGALIAIGILILSWLLPWGYTNDQAAQIWSADNNPWVVLQNTWNRLVSVTGGENPANHGNFTGTLTLGGNPNLVNTVVFRVKSTDGSQYLQSLSYDVYNGRSWINSPQGMLAIPANQVTSDGSLMLRQINQTIYVVNAPGEDQPYLLGASQIASTDQGAQISSNTSDDTTVAWLRNNGKLAAGNQYTVISYASNADIQTLRAVPLPANSPTIQPGLDVPVPPTYYNPAVVKAYTQLPTGLDPNILAKAKQITAGANNMYDMAVALENYLRSNYTYSVNINPPPGEEPVSWFLFRSGNRGFCNYFASAMTIMARELGMPARVAVGYTNGKQDAKTGQWIISGTDAHAWVQIYFAGYGWVNFEPSASFNTFSRPTTSSGVAPILPPLGGGTTGKGPNGTRLNHPNDVVPVTDSLNGDQAQGQASLRAQIGITLLGLLVLILGGLVFFSVWWRRLFRGLSISTQIYGRVCLLADWAGISTRRSQTPYEHMHALAEATPDQAVTLERLGDIYVRERWADPQSADHPRHTGEIDELPGLWKDLQRRLAFYVLRHPHFLRLLPGQASRSLRRLRPRRERPSSSVIVEEQIVSSDTNTPV